VAMPIDRQRTAPGTGDPRLGLLLQLRALDDALEHEEVFAALARLALPDLGSWCIVDVLEDGRLRRAAAAHVDPALSALADELLAVELDEGYQCAMRAIAGKGSLYMSTCDRATLRERIGSDQLRAELERIDARSLLIVPYVKAGRLEAAAIHASCGERARRFDGQDLALGEELMRRAGRVVENARLNRQLRDSEERFRMALANGRTSVFDLDSSLAVRWLYNPTPEMMSLGLGEGRAAAGLAEVEALLRRVLSTGQSATSEVRTEVDGTERYSLLSLEPVRDGLGDVDGVLGAATDITPAKQAAEELKRTLAFRDQMISVLGHDLRNPLSAIIGMSQLVRSDPQAPSNEQLLGQIEAAARRMTELVETLLEFAQLRFADRIPIAATAGDLGVLCRRLVTELGGAFPGRTIVVAVDGDAQGHWDLARIGQVVSNLVVNALVHGDASAPVHLRIDGGGEAIELSVHNRGPAIPPELAAMVFEPFWRAASGRRRHQGLGLGLYIANEMVLAHGGKISLTSTGEDGTTFRVRLPRHCAATAPAKE